MKAKVSLDSILKPSDDVVARDIQGEMVIIPIASGKGDLEDGIFTLNKTGKALWGKLDGKKKLREIAKELGEDFQGSLEKIEKDVLGISRELLKRKIIIESKKS